MSEYRINQTSATASTVIIAGLLASQSIAAHVPPNASEDSNQALFAARYKTEAQLPSFEQYRGIFGGVSSFEGDPFIESVSSFYAKLVAMQEPLGEDFSRVLHENLWELYER